MGLNTNEPDSECRQRVVDTKNRASPTLPPPIDDDNNNTKWPDIEYRFDEEISTLKTPAAEAIISSNLANGHLMIASTEQLDKELKAIGAKTPILPSQIGTDFNFKRQIVWFNTIGFIVLHLCALLGIYYAVGGHCNSWTTLYSFILIYGSGLGVTMGAHRLWSHRSFKANVYLRIFLLWLHTLAGQNCLYIWVRDHRQHHKYSDTDADPHNANRGFFFSHIGWLMSRKHPKVIEFGHKIDMSDLEADPWIMFQKKHYKVLYTLFSLLLPTSVPIIYWNEDPWYALFVAFFARTMVQLNATWLVNSAAHLYGTRPFDKTIFPVESWWVAFLAVGEGWHNYHHAFPWDYRASELGSPLNLTGFLIDMLAKCNLIFDRKAASHHMVKNRVMRTGDKSHKEYGTLEGQSAVKTLFNMWKHPMNPTYNSIYLPKPKIIGSDGYALIPDEMTINEKDDKILQIENAKLAAQLSKEEAIKFAEPIPINTTDTSLISDKLKQYIVDKADATKLMVKFTKLFDEPGDCSKCNGSSSLNCNGRLSSKNSILLTKDKSELNINVDEALFVKI